MDTYIQIFVALVLLITCYEAGKMVGNTDAVLRFMDDCAKDMELLDKALYDWFLDKAREEVRRDEK